VSGVEADRALARLREGTERLRTGGGVQLSAAECEVLLAEREELLGKITSGRAGEQELQAEIVELRRGKIDPGLASSMAGMVAVGLTPGDDHLDRAVAALLAVGMMLQNATDDPRVDEALGAADRAVVERMPGGGLRVTVLAP
jgi:hypothetical protein